MYFFYCVTSASAFYSLSLHGALPISMRDSWLTMPTLILPIRLHGRTALEVSRSSERVSTRCGCGSSLTNWPSWPSRSEEHTSELQPRRDFVCRLLLEKKKDIKIVISL